ncbi:MAG: hypothetical protein KAR42_11160 [candidate division Zixibacteria bacterium]|nr:hypothetical protein [candidate division Zixibacteria bacterium]
MTNLLNEMLNNDDVNLWSVAGSTYESKTAISEVIKTASTEELTQLIIKFDGHQQFNAESLICYGKNETSITEEEYGGILDEHDL